MEPGDLVQMYSWPGGLFILDERLVGTASVTWDAHVVANTHPSGSMRKAFPLGKAVRLPEELINVVGTRSGQE